MGSIVVDIGGTNLRLAYYDQGRLADIRRVPVENFQRNPELGSDALYDRFRSQLLAEIGGLLAAHPAAAVGIAFPGPVDGHGNAARAPTLWGDRVRDVSLREDLTRLLGRTVHVLNDISAATWRYAAPQGEDFCLITISSGIGNKVYRQGQILLNPQGMGGEIGHCQVAEGDDALPCDCGGRGHLGALASGRGTLRLAQLYAGRYPADLAASPLAAQDPSTWTTVDLVAALHADDVFAWKACEAAQRYLVAAMRQLYHWIGIRRFVFIGGFATAIGQPYIDRLNLILRQESWFGMTPADLAGMCSLGHADDDHSLIGMGRYLAMREKV